MPKQPLTTKVLRRKLHPEEYRVYRAALEWDLTNPIVIENRSDLRSELGWKDRLSPYHHQITNLITFCRRLPCTLLADDVGLGKTISAGLIISELIARSRLSKILVVCPKLLGPQWQEELDCKFGIKSQIATGRELVDADFEKTGAVITTYHSARTYLEQIPEDRFQMLVLDEAHKLRNLYGTTNAPQVAKVFRRVLEKRRFRFVLMLTATPLQNRLWDLYSLVDLLTVARGHQNPFGDENAFARRFIADDRTNARRLKQTAQEEFRTTVYGYMSRIRRGDANLSFPDRVVQMHRVQPTKAELALIKTIAIPIQSLNKLAQISILQALTSSPQALLAQIVRMSANGTVPASLSAVVQSIVSKMPPSAKLTGLGGLIEQLKQKNPDRWRLIVFTCRIETQSTIKAFLQQQGITCGIINGTSGGRNQDTLVRFRKNPPECHVIVSTEAGSEGLNLQVANVLVNYDLPWNPMIVEQRIGRVQRLASEHAKVAIFNIMLQGTFEEYIVGRLMEKLQLASHAIGDIEALLEASGINEDGEDGATSFDERLRQLVIAALSGKNVEKATKQAEQSIADAKHALEQEQTTINDMLGSMDQVKVSQPRAPRLPLAQRSMDCQSFSLAALQLFGPPPILMPDGLFVIQEKGRRELIRFDDNAESGERSTLYTPTAPAFLRLVSNMIATGIHDIEDLDPSPANDAEVLARKWVASFGGTSKAVNIKSVHRCFDGHALARVRATVAHDSYERLIDVACLPDDHFVSSGKTALQPVPKTIDQPETVGLNLQIVADKAKHDSAVSEFCRYYLERCEQEIVAAGTDARKRKKLEDEFTPRSEVTLVGLNGRMFRIINLTVNYSFQDSPEYTSRITIAPASRKLTEVPETALCAISGHKVPRTCLAPCQISGKIALSHLLVWSEVSGRCAVPECTAICSLSGKRVLTDELAYSAVSSQPVATSLLRTSTISGKRAEPCHFGRCEFTGADALQTELAVSELSGKDYRVDQQARSAISNKAGHQQEFIICQETRQQIALSEAERCEVTGVFVRPGILETCAVTTKRVLPSELKGCVVTGQRVLKKLLVASSLSDALLQENVAIHSTTGKYCLPAEATRCLWSGAQHHPDDITVCALTGVSVHRRFITGGLGYLQTLGALLKGDQTPADETPIWDKIASDVATKTGRKKCSIESAVLSPDKKHLAVCAEIRVFLGLSVRQTGLLYSIQDKSIVGRIAEGKRTRDGWQVA